MKQQVLIVEDEFIVANHLRTLLQKADYEICGIAASVTEAKILIEKKKPTWVLLDIFLQDGSMGTDLGDFLHEKGIAFIYISANSNIEILEKAKSTQPYGFLVKPFRERDLLTMMEIAREKHLNQIHFNQQLLPILQNQLELISYSSLSTEDKLNKLPATFQALIPFDLFSIRFSDMKPAGMDEITFIRAGYNEYQMFKSQDFKDYIGMPAKGALKSKDNDWSIVDGNIFNGKEYLTLQDLNPFEKSVGSRFQLQCKLLFVMELKGGNYTALSFYSRKPEFYKPIHSSFLIKAIPQLSFLLENIERINTGTVSAKANDGLRKAKRISAEKTGNPEFPGVIGKSPALLSVLDKVSMVSPSQTSVLILGESGTGKERIAQCIHLLSPRHSKPMITLNCGALQKDLIESELFGHEKGAFTGAIDNRIGKFELADGGTIFLDEVGELSLEAQVKLLRALQEREIEHVGGSRAIKVNVRVIAATNRNLEKEVAAGHFRLDLYYRLNVFPIELPSLRDRKEDIRELAVYFIDKYSRQLEKEAPALGKEALKQLESYSWPGNIRELEHLLERSLVLNLGAELNEIHLPSQRPVIEKPTAENNGSKTLEQMEADYIISVLKKCNGKIGGPCGAAEILGLPSSTLNSKIKKLNIRRESYYNL